MARDGLGDRADLRVFHLDKKATRILVASEWLQKTGAQELASHGRPAGVDGAPGWDRLAVLRTTLFKKGLFRRWRQSQRFLQAARRLFAMPAHNPREPE